MKFKQNTNIVEAILYTGKNLKEVEEFVGSQLFTITKCNIDPNVEPKVILEIPTNSGNMLASPYDWIVRNEKTGLYVCDNKTFEDGYVYIDEGDPNSYLCYQIIGSGRAANHDGEMCVPVCRRNTYHNVKSIKEAINQFFEEFPDVFEIQLVQCISPGGGG